MKTNSIFKIKDLNKTLAHCFQDTNLEEVDLDNSSKELSYYLKEATCVEDVFTYLINFLRKQQDRNLSDSRSLVREAIKTFAKNKEPGTLAELSIGEHYWKLSKGQVFLINSNKEASSEIYQHLMFNLIIPKNLRCISFMEEAKAKYIHHEIINHISSESKNKDVSYNPALVQLKNNVSFVESSYFLNADHFENQVKYLVDKYDTHMIYIDDVLSVNFENTKELTRQLQLQKAGELLLHLANELNICFVLKNQHEPDDLKTITFELGNILNFTEQAIHLQTNEADSFSDIKFFELFDLKAYPFTSVDTYFEKHTHLISTFKD